MPPSLPTDTEMMASTDPVARTADAMEDEQSARREALLASKPQMKPVSVKAVQSLVEALNGLTEAVGGPGTPDAQMPEVLDPKTGKPAQMIDAGVPDGLYLVVAAIASLLMQVEGGAFAKKYDLDPADMADEKGLKMTTRAIEALAKNKKCVAAIKAAMGPAPEMEEPASEEVPKGPPSGHPLSETGRALAAGMP